MSYESLKTLKAQVRYMLDVYPNTRNDDRFLITELCRIFHRDALKNASSIERFRRMLNQKGLYLPTEEAVAKMRRLNIDNWRIVMGYPTQTTSGTNHPSWYPPLKEDVNKIVSANQQRMFP